MLPIDWKKEIQESTDEAAKALAVPLNAIRTDLDTYIRKQDGYEKGKRCRDFATIIGLFLTALFTLALAVASVLQTYAFIQSERGFLAVTGFQIEGGLTPNKPIVLQYGMTNSGKSTASISNLSLNIVSELPDPLKYQPVKSAAFNPIPAGQTGLNLFKPDSANNDQALTVTEEQVRAINSGATKLYIFGFIEISDDFSWLMGNRQSKFCYLYIPARSTPATSVFGGCPVVSNKK